MQWSMRVGVDASNLRQGGGVTHLVQLLAAAVPGDAEVSRVTVWGGRDILEVLPDRPWLERCHESALDRHGLSRTRWQQRALASLAAKSVDVLFSPGGTYLGGFRPFVTMFRNMLPFDTSERRRYGLSRMRLKLEILRRAQGATFGRADGVIFLTEHARAHVLGQGVRIPGCSLKLRGPSCPGTRSPRDGPSDGFMCPPFTSTSTHGTSLRPSRI
jgi:hypothetical protein